METKQTTVFKHSLNYGIILGITGVIYSLFLFIINQSLNRTLNWLGLIITIVVLVMAMKSYRDNVLGGSINYGKALGIGILVCLISGIISAIYSYINVNFIDTSLVEKSLQMAEEKMLDKGLSEDMIEMQINMSRKFMSPVMMAIMAIVSSVIGGTILSLIIAAFIKKEDNSVITGESTE